jgi:serine/threonine protein phosphatase PrpC
MNIQFKITAQTHVGAVRDHNEDNFIICPDLVQQDWFFNADVIYNPQKPGALWVVADGMGGTNAGEVASEITVKTISEIFSHQIKADSEIPRPEEFLPSVIRQINEAILSHERRHPETEGMGTTVVMAWLLDEQLHVSWVGDSRAYLFRNNSLIPITKDHSLVQQMVDAGTLTEEQAFYHPQSNIITQSLGGPTHKLKPGYTCVNLNKNDKILLCTDGLNGMITDQNMQQILIDYPEIKEACTALLQQALTNGGYDNVTLILAHIMDGPIADKSVSIESVKNNEAETVAGNQQIDRPTGSIKIKKKYFWVIPLIICMCFIAGFFFKDLVDTPGKPQEPSISADTGKTKLPEYKDSLKSKKNIDKGEIRSKKEKEEKPASPTINPDRNPQTIEEKNDSVSLKKEDKNKPETNVKTDTTNNKATPVPIITPIPQKKDTSQLKRMIF